MVMPSVTEEPEKTRKHLLKDLFVGWAAALSIKHKIGFCFTLIFTLMLWTASADDSPAGQTQFQTRQQELRGLVAKSGSNNSPGTDRADKNFSPDLTKSENDRLLVLLRDREAADGLPLELALAALKQRETDGSLPGFQYNALMDVVNRRWSHDPVVIAFYRKALTTRGDAAIFELLSPSPGIWDDSLLEGVVRLIEISGSDSTSQHTSKSKDAPWMVMDRAFSVLNRHYSVWATNASIPPRLSKAVLTTFPSLTNAAMPGPHPGDQMWCNAINMLAQTHNLAMVTVLRPFLKDKVVAGDGSMWIENRTPLRACDKAAISINQLLGDTENFEPGIAMSGIINLNTHDSYPEWDKWDKKIAKLQKRLDMQPSQALRVVITPSRTDIRFREIFNLALRVENPTQTNQTVRVMSCGWDDEWRSSNTNVSWIGWDCTRNGPVNVTILPGGAYTNTLEMEIYNLIPQNRLSFRMGFTSIDGAKTLWSNKVKLHILPPEAWWGGKYYRDRNHDGKIDWEASGNTWMGHSVYPGKRVTNSNGDVGLRLETTGQGVDTYKVDTNYDGFYDLMYGAGGTNYQIQWTTNIHERVPVIGKDFVPIGKESWMDQWMK